MVLRGRKTGLVPLTPGVPPLESVVCKPSLKGEKMTYDTTTLARARRKLYRLREAYARSVEVRIQSSCSEESDAAEYDNPPPPPVKNRVRERRVFFK